jgi:hypothetical protein
MSTSSASHLAIYAHSSVISVSDSACGSCIAVPSFTGTFPSCSEVRRAPLSGCGRSGTDWNSACVLPGEAGAANELLVKLAHPFPKLRGYIALGGVFEQGPDPAALGEGRGIVEFAEIGSGEARGTRIHVDSRFQR